MREIMKVKPSVPMMHRKKRVAAYARVSLESERLMHSLSAQISYYSEFIQNNPEWEYAGVYADEGISGTQTERRGEFKRLIKDCEDGKIDIILVKSISRFARNTVDLLKTVRRLKELGIEVRFEKENISSLSADGELMLSILASFAQEESRSISENVKWSTRKRFEQGIPNGRIKVFGYRWEGDTLMIVPEEAEIVQRIFRDFLAGGSPRKIAKQLNDDGINSPQECGWGDFSIRYILTNITYTGNLLLQKGFVEDPIEKHRRKNRGELPRFFVENTHEAIIEQYIFDNAQKGFIQRSENRKTAFTKKIKCAECGSYYIRNSVGKGEYYNIWTCSVKRKQGSTVCVSKSIREDILKEISAEVLETAEFDDNIFLDKIDSITVEGSDTLHFNFYDGRIVTKHWHSTLKKESWTSERRAAKSESMKEIWKERKNNGGKSSADNTGNN